jgi:hypothetical protein
VTLIPNEKARCVREGLEDVGWESLHEGPNVNICEEQHIVYKLSDPTQQSMVMPGKIAYAL